LRSGRFVRIYRRINAVKLQHIVRTGLH